MSKQEDLDFLHPDVGQHVRLPMDQVADPARRDKWVSSKSRPDQLYLRPECPLNAQGRRMFRWMALVSHETHPKLGPVVKGAIACSLPVPEMATSAANCKYEPPKPKAAKPESKSQSKAKSKSKKSKKRKSPEPSSQEAPSSRTKVKTKGPQEPGRVEAQALLRV